jgi:hypothetical protein
MANTIRIKRSTGSAAPTTLQNAELSYSEGVAGGGTLFIGVGTGGAGGSATSVIAIGGPSVYASKSYVDSAISNANLSNYLTTSAAASTYLSQATAASTYATQSSVSTAISNVINAAPAALDTLKELADALGSDAAFSTTVTTSISGKLAKASNLSDVADVSAARTNLGLGSMATQSAGNVAITGGSIDNVTLDGGTY